MIKAMVIFEGNGAGGHYTFAYSENGRWLNIADDQVC